MTDNAIARRRYAVPPYEPAFREDQIRSGAAGDNPEHAYNDFMSEYGHLHPRVQRQAWEDFALLSRSRELREKHNPPYKLPDIEDVMKNIPVPQELDDGEWLAQKTLEDYGEWLKSPRRQIGPYPGLGKW